MKRCMRCNSEVFTITVINNFVKMSTHENIKGFFCILSIVLSSPILMNNDQTLKIRLKSERKFCNSKTTCIFFADTIKI